MFCCRCARRFEDAFIAGMHNNGWHHGGEDLLFHSLPIHDMLEVLHIRCEYDLAAVCVSDFLMNLGSIVRDFLVTQLITGSKVSTLMGLARSMTRTDQKQWP
eukprot:3808964-Amphidinium_carterae.1